MIDDFAQLPLRYTPKQLELFLNKIDFYQSDYELRHYKGVVWYDDGTWSELNRCNQGYDSWKHFCPPMYFDEMKGIWLSH